MATRILVVDDVASERMNMCEILQRAGFQTIEADSGETALDIALRELPALVLMDIVMPGMNGFAATKRLTEDPLTAQIPVVMVSAKVQDSDKFRAKSVGARGYLVKPMSAETLVGIVRRLTEAA